MAEVRKMLNLDTRQTNTAARQAAVIKPLWLLPIIPAIFFPWISAILFGLWARSRMQRPIGALFLASTVVGFIALLNSTKELQGDWRWYVADYQDFLNVNLADYLQLGGLSIRNTEPVYYLASFALSRISNGNVFLLAILITIAIYMVYIYAIEGLLKTYRINGLHAAVCIVFAAFAGITFTLSLHLVRQYIAGSMLFLYFALLLEGKYKKAALAFLVGSLVHNSFALPAGLLTICVYASASIQLIRHYLAILLLLAVSGYSAGAFFSSVVYDSAFAVAAFKDDGLISPPVLVFDVVLFLVSLAGIVRLREDGRFNTKCSVATVLFLGFYGGVLFGANDLPLFLLRFYFYIEWFRIVGVITIVWFARYRMKNQILALLILPVSILVLELRIMQSPFDFGGTALDHFTGSRSWWAAPAVQ